MTTKTPREVMSAWFDRGPISSPDALAGFVIVPREPTRQMWAAGGTAIVHTRARTGSHDDQCGAVWEAMLAAVQETPGEKVSG